MNIHRFRMTASEIAMGRYMRAPDHPADPDFDNAFAQFATPEPGEKKPDEAAAAGADGGAAAGGADDGGGDAGAAAAGGEPGGADGTGGGDGGAGAAAGAEGGADGAAGAADAGAAGGADAGGADGAAAGADKGAEPKPDAAGGPSADDILDGLKKLVGQAPAAGAAEKPADTGAAAAEEKPIYTKEETDRLAKYEEDWKEVADCEALKRRAEYQALLSHVFKQVVDFVKPIQETAEALAQRSFTTDVQGAVPDYSDQLRSEVVDWVKSQPTYLQVAYNHVIEEGTVDEVKDLVERYRTATGKAAPKPSGDGGAQPEPKDKGNELSSEAKKAAEKMAPVDSKRSGVANPGDPSNFDDAWKEAAGLG